MLDNEVVLSTSNQPSKLRTRNWIEINDESRGTYTADDTKFKTTMLRSNSCHYADAYILVNGRITITVAKNDGAGRQTDEMDKGVTFKMVLSKSVIFGSKKWRFIKNKKARGLLSNLGVKTRLSKVLILGDTLFLVRMLDCI